MDLVPRGSLLWSRGSELARAPCLLRIRPVSEPARAPLAVGAEPEAEESRMRGAGSEGVASTRARGAGV